ncbi:Sericotropin [Operophtera brumata]|uniref:Sericotropin n=1 Tax=Operophtera brumata TaxID=104452 RepID=A0A0L7L8I6_OPEBR|nr:Sericotropin [Operophtera brumata]
MLNGTQQSAGSLLVYKACPEGSFTIVSPAIILNTVMKIFVVFAVCIVVAQALSDEQKEKLKKHRSECLTETKAEEQLVNKLKTGDYKVILAQNYNLLSAINFFYISADRPAAEKLIDTCLATKGNTPHQTAWNYVKCYHEKDPKHAIFL